MSLHARALARFGQMRREIRAGGLVESHVRDDSAAEKCGNALAGTIEELIGDQEIERRQIVAQRSDSAGGNNSLDAQQFHRVNVRAIIDFARRKKMTSPMPR